MGRFNIDCMGHVVILNDMAPQPHPFWLLISLIWYIFVHVCMLLKWKAKKTYHCGGQFQNSKRKKKGERDKMIVHIPGLIQRIEYTVKKPE
jgi:hypothetical protein